MKLTRQLLKEMVLKEMSNFSYDQAGSAGSMGLEGVYKEAFEILKNPQGPAQMVFITAHNPPYKKTKQGGIEWNNEVQQNKLLEELSGYKNLTVGQGQYMGEAEETIMVFSNNPTVQNKFKEHMIKLGKYYLQDAIVYAEKWSGMAMDPSKGEYPITPDGEKLPTPSGFQAEEGGPRYFWYLQMINLKPDSTKYPTDVMDWEVSKYSTYMLSNPSIQGRQDDFTKVGDRKYYIPFYEDYPEEFIANAEPV